MNQSKSYQRPGLILLVTTVTSFMTAFMGSSLNIALPVIGSEFSSSAKILSWISTVYFLITAVLLIPVGKLSDTKGRMYFFSYGLIVFTGSTFLCGISGSTAIIILFRALQGVGSSFIFATGTALIVTAYPANQRGRVLGINTASVYTGLSSGPFLGGFITQYLGWRGIFFTSAIIGLVIILIVSFMLKGIEEQSTSEKYDIMGSIVYSLSIVSAMIGISMLPGITGIILTITGTILLIVFFNIEKKIINPLFDVRIFKSNRTFTYSNLSALINYCATFAISFLISFYLQIVKGLKPREAGIILITQPVLQAVFSPYAGKLSDRFEPQLVSSTGMAFLTIGLVIFCFLTPGTGYGLIIGNLAFLGLGFALFSSPNVNAIMSSVDRHYYGVASSTLASMRVIGQTLSMGIVIMIFTFYLGERELSPLNSAEFMESARTLFILFSILSVAGIFASLARGNIHSK